MKTIYRVLLVAFFVGVPLLVPAKGQSRGVGPPNGFKHLVFANTYHTTDAAGAQNDYVSLGHYDFLDEQTVHYTYFLYDARKDLKPTAARVRHPIVLPANAGAVPGPIHLPTYVAEQQFRGTWAMNGRTLRIRIGSVLHEWQVREGDNGFFIMRAPYTNVQDGSNVIDGLAYSGNFGYGYGSDRTVLPQRVSPRDLLPDYDGEIYSLHQPQGGGPRQWTL